MFDEEAAVLEADTMLSSEGEKKEKNRRTDPTLGLSALAPELSLEPTRRRRRRRLGGTREWRRYLPRLSAEGRKTKSRKESRIGSRAEGE